MSVSVIIPTATRARSLAATLEHLCHQSIKAAEFEVLVVDNGSGEDTRSAVEAAIRNHPQHTIKYFEEPVPGLLSGRHRGALEAQSELLVFIDDDVDIAGGWLRAVLDGFRNSNVHLIGGRNLPRYEVIPPLWLDSFWGTTPYGGRMCVYLSLLDMGDTSRVIDPNYVWGLNLAIRRSTLFALGGFHPDCIPPDLQRFQGDGETGLTAKANEMGIRALYEPAATVWHRIPATRLTLEYFKHRAFYEGVALSYSAIRQQRGVSQESWQSRYHLADSFSGLEASKGGVRRVDLRNFCQAIGFGKEKQVLRIRRAVRRAFLKGFEFHHKETSLDPKLLKWILRKDYWNYQLSS